MTLSGKETILIVDDEPRNLAVVSDFLKDEGFRIASANCGKLAIERAKSINPSLILLDINMPGMSGLEACRILKASSETSAIPVLFMTALVDVEDKVRGFQAGAVDYITKPIQKDELLARVNTHLKLFRYSSNLEQEVNRQSEEIRKSRNLLADIIDTMPSVIIGVSADGLINLWNKEAAILTGIDADDAMGQIFVKVISSLKINLSEYKNLLFSEEVFKIPLIHTKSLSRFEYSSLAVYILTREGNEGKIYRIDDVTDQHSIQELLHHSQKMQAIGELASGVAHDFNNQLAGIMGSAEILAMDMEEGSDSLALVDTIQASVKRSADLTKKLLSFARKGNMVSTAVPMLPILKEVVTLLKHGLKRNITIEVISDSENYTVLGDGSQLQNALLNLGINARDAVEEGGCIQYIMSRETFDVTTHGLPAGEYLHLCVKDNGSGIPLNIVENIFTPFFTTKGEGKGTGMGLAAVKGTIQSHNGEIALETMTGEGTSFHIYLPLINNEEERKKPDEMKIQFDRKLNILCVDDEPILADLASTLLRRLGHTVTAVNSGEKAVEAYCTNSFDLVLLDMVMPGMDGAETYKAINQYDSGANVVIASGYADNIVSQSLFDMGVKEFLVKPYQLVDLVRIIRSIFYT